MEGQTVNMRNLHFLLYEVLEVESLTRYPRFKEHSREIFDLVLQTGAKMASEHLAPYLAEMDRNPPRLVDGRVRVHPAVRTFMRACGEGGWIGAHTSHARGGQQMPGTIMTAFRFLLAAANYSASVYPALTAGAAHLIESFGSEELIATYVPQLYAGKWQGTMALTEPQAGSSLADLTTSAKPTDQGHHLVRGQKIFISAADHDAVDNVVNLLLARIQGAPTGTRGISLFVVPQRRPDADGRLVGNDVTVQTLYHKMGYNGLPLTQLSLGESDDCRGWLVGEPHRGLRYMFQMMNEARIEVGMGATAIASAAYHAALQYARQRSQGRRITERDPHTPQIPIIEHADVKRMLLFQRAVVEGALSLVLQCARWADLLTVLEGKEKERVGLLLDLLTPVAKSYPSEMGVLSVSAGLQCLGGYGYCNDFPLEQHLRDIRIHPIHEGTTGIQGLDLLGRKIVAKNGQAAFLFLEEVGRTIQEAGAQEEDLGPESEALATALDRLRDVTGHLSKMALGGEIERFLADATLYLELFGIVAVAWQWLLQAIVAQRALQSDPTEAEACFYRGKLLTCRFFFAYELPRSEGLAHTLKQSGGLTLEMRDELF